MAFNLEKINSGGGKSYAKPETKIQEGRIARVIDLGIQPAHPKWPDSKPKRVLSVMIELTEDFIEIEGEKKPMFAFYKVNVAGKKPSGEHSRFTQLVELTGKTKEVSVKDFLGIPVSVTLAEDREEAGKLTSLVASVSGLSERVAKTVPPLVAEAYAFDFDDPEEEVLEKLGEKTIEKLKGALNYSGSKVEAILEKEEDEVL